MIVNFDDCTSCNTSYNVLRHSHIYRGGAVKKRGSPDSSSPEVGISVNGKNLCLKLPWSFMSFIVYCEQKLPDDLSVITYPSSSIRKSARGGLLVYWRGEEWSLHLRFPIGLFTPPYLKRSLGSSILWLKVKAYLLFSSRGLSCVMV